MERKNIAIDDCNYIVDTNTNYLLDDRTPRLVVVSYLPNRTAQIILEVCIQTIIKFTPIEYELWVIDNNSPPEFTGWLMNLTNVNLVFNRTKPASSNSKGLVDQILSRMKILRKPAPEASYANAIGLELAARLIPPNSHYLVTLHMDIMPCHPGWLSYIKSKIDLGFAAAGMRMDTTRVKEGVLHILGCMIDFQVFRALNLSFLPELPHLDVGDRVTTRLREAGYPVYACRNTLWDSRLVNNIPSNSPMRDFPVDRSLDDRDNVIFLHLGRGILKSFGGGEKSVSPAEWITFAQNHLL